MPLRWFDSVDFYTAISAFPYEANNGVSIGSSFARTGRNGFQFSGAANWVRKNLGGNYASLVVGAAIQSLTVPAAIGVLGFCDNGTPQVGAAIDSVGRAQITSGSGATLAVSSSNPFLTNQFHYMELEVVSFGVGGAGITNVYADGSMVLSYTGTNIQTANAYANQMMLGKQINGGSGTYNMDDIYCLDESGAAPWNAPLGDSFVVARMPSASGSFAQWTPNPAGSNLNWQRVDEIPADGITTYNQASATGSRDSFVYPTWPPVGITLPNIAAIMAVMELEYGETDSAGTATVQLIPRQAGTDDTSAVAITLGVGFAYGYSIWQKDVNGNLWLPPNLNATEYGYKRIS